MELSKCLIDELFNIGKNMPVFAGDLQSHQGAEELIELGLVMRYEGKYVLTEKGKEEFKIESAKQIARRSVVNKWAKNNW